MKLIKISLLKNKQEKNIHYSKINLSYTNEEKAIATCNIIRKSLLKVKISC
jgi:hypothetical protein